MDQSINDINRAIDLAHTHTWIPLAAVVLGLLIRIMKSDTAVRWFPIEISPRWRAWFSFGGGLVYGILHKVATGGTWGEAIVGGFLAGGGPIVGHELVVNALRNGRDLGMKKEDAPPPSQAPRQPVISIRPPSMPTFMLLLVLGLALAGCGLLRPACGEEYSVTVKRSRAPDLIADAGAAPSDAQ